MWTVCMGYLLGLVQGVRHAFEPDHLAAVSTLVAEQRSAKGSALYAAFWGVGHAMMLLVVGGLLFALRRAMPPVLEHAFELVVAVMLVALGIRALRRALSMGRAGSSPHPRPRAPRPSHPGPPRASP